MLETDKLILNFIWKCKEHRIIKTSLTKKKCRNSYITKHQDIIRLQELRVYEIGHTWRRICDTRGRAYCTEVDAHSLPFDLQWGWQQAQRGKKCLSKNSLGLIDIHMEKNESWVLHHMVLKNQFQMNSRFKCER